MVPPHPVIVSDLNLPGYVERLKRKPATKEERGKREMDSFACRPVSHLMDEICRMTAASLREEKSVQRDILEQLCTAVPR